MAALFDPIPLRLSAGEARFELRLDADEPYLGDHRPGGHPLFATVMAIEATVAAARVLGPTTAPASVADVRVLKPYIAVGSGPHTLELSLRRSRAGPAPQFDCTLRSKDGDGTESHHLQARVEFCAQSSKSSPGELTIDQRIDSAAQPAVSQADIYELFFHGPAFQVIAGGEFRARTMHCRLNSVLPPSHRHRAVDSEISPRLIEFALQSAGLLELAVTGRLMIPHRIASIVRLSGVDVDHHGEISSIARFGCQQRSCIDIDLFDECGRPIMRVGQYRTEPLPFAVNEPVSARLRARMLESFTSA